jgi:nucleotide-binding universal stress UspA family protein
MPTIKHILFPFDFSAQGSEAAPFVRTIAGHYNAKVSVLSVIPPIWNSSPAARPPLAGLDAPEHELQERMDEALAQEFAGFAACRLTELGDPALKILEFARTKGVDLIMMPTHGVGGYRSMLLGSVTVKVLHEAKCPVWTATHAEEQASPAQPRKILCAIDRDSQTERLMRWASEFSQQMGVNLKLLHVVQAAGGAAALPSIMELQEQMREAARAKLEAIMRSAWVEGSLHVTIGGIAETIAEEARREEADLIILGRGLLSSPLGRLRSNAYAIIQQSPCPVVSV